MKKSTVKNRKKKQRSRHVWLVGEIVGVERGALGRGMCRDWKLRGIYTSEAKAQAACPRLNHFVVKQSLDTEVLHELLWHNAYSYCNIWKVRERRRPEKKPKKQLDLVNLDGLSAWGDGEEDDEGEKAEAIVDGPAIQED